MFRIAVELSLPKIFPKFLPLFSRTPDAGFEGSRCKRTPRAIDVTVLLFEVAFLVGLFYRLSGLSNVTPKRRVTEMPHAVETGGSHDKN